jgi:hypothetical protein
MSERSTWMKKPYVGLVALAGTLLLLVLWFAQHERQAAFERLETYKLPNRSESVR